MTESDAKRLEEIYKMIPDIKCQKKCSYNCGPITMTQGEAERIWEETNHPVKKCGEDMQCSYLTDEGLCSIHPIRPVICRLWGVVDSPEMTCPHGCEVVGEKLSNEQTYMILQLIEMVSGQGEDYVATHPENFKQMVTNAFGEKAAEHFTSVNHMKSTDYK